MFGLKIKYGSEEYEQALNIRDGIELKESAIIWEMSIPQILCPTCINSDNETF